MLTPALVAGCTSEPDAPLPPDLGSEEAPRLEAPVSLLVSPWREANAEAMKPVARVLSRRLGAELRIQAASSYQDAIDGIVEGRADFAFLPPLSFLKAKRREPGLVLLCSEEIRATLHDRAVLVVRNEGGPSSVDGLKDRRFALVSPESASGYLFPRVCLRRHGLDPDVVLAKDKVLFTHNHDAVLEKVLEGECDVGATYDWVVTEPTGRLRDDVRVVAWSEPLPHSVIVARKGLEPKVRQAVRLAFLGLTRTRARRPGLLAAMEKLGITGFAEISDAALDPLRRIEAEAGR